MSVTDNKQSAETDGKIAPVRERLRSAALALFTAQGFDHTSAAQIAARAEVTERTFFRYFADKREALFDGEAILSEGLTAALQHIHVGDEPLGALHQAFRTMIPTLEKNRAFAAARQALIEQTPTLREREAAKLETLAMTLDDALQAKGVQAERSFLAARAGIATFTLATTRWLSDTDIELDVQLEGAFEALHSLI